MLIGYGEYTMKQYVLLLSPTASYHLMRVIKLFENAFYVLTPFQPFTKAFGYPNQNTLWNRQSKKVEILLDMLL